jgi:putative membrane protein
MVFADSDLSLLPPNFLGYLFGSVIFFALGLVLLAVAFWAIDRITPGKLADELCPPNRDAAEAARPNVALGLVVSALVLAVGLIVAAAIH